MISIGIPVYNTEKYLVQTLKSVITQDFDDFEILVLSDASKGKSVEGWTCKKIVRLMQKECNSWRRHNKLKPVKIHYLEHSQNRGLVEAKRTLCYEAKGEYYTQLDSDDLMEPGALSVLYKTLIETNADIVHGTSTAGHFDENGNFIKSEKNRNGTIYYGEIYDHDIMTNWLVKQQFTSVLWGKLVRRNLLVKAFENIPYTENFMADDILVFFFLARYLHKYVGIKNKVLLYRDNSGVTSAHEITSLERWKISCTGANAFSIISEFLKEKHDDFVLTPEESEAIRDKAMHFLIMALRRLNADVVPELKLQAYAMLCDYWGKEFVVQVDQALAQDAREKLNGQSPLPEEK